MQVLLTIVLIVAIAMWATAVYSHLVRLRNNVTQAWKRLEADQANAAIRAVYNKHAEVYNKTLAGFSGGLIGGAAGFKPAKPFSFP
ncbi:MAG: hypothetical protein ACKOEC_19115 [Acidimicrobiia bacterium]